MSTAVFFSRGLSIIHVDSGTIRQRGGLLSENRPIYAPNKSHPAPGRYIDSGSISIRVCPAAIASQLAYLTPRSSPVIRQRPLGPGLWPICDRIGKYPRPPFWKTHTSRLLLFLLTFNACVLARIYRVQELSK